MESCLSIYTQILKEFKIFLRSVEFFSDLATLIQILQTKKADSSLTTNKK